MKFNYLTNEQLSTALNQYSKVLKEAGYKADVEEINSVESCGRLSARAIYAGISAPHYLASAMDGIALKAKLSFDASETTPVVLKENEYTVVDTGDPLPEGCDAVIMIEEVVFDNESNATIYEAATPWQHVRQIGEDICAGEMIIGANTVIEPSTIGAFLAAGVLKVPVLRKPIVGIIPTGDEIVEPTADPKPGDIIEFNSSIFSSMLKQKDCETIVYPIIKDKPELLDECIKKALSQCDIVLTNAGSSAGRDDNSADVISDNANILYHGLAIKPGKPAVLANNKNKPVICIPGYPVSGIIVMQEIVLPLIDLWYKQSPVKQETCKAILTKRLMSGLKYEEFVRTRLGYVEDKFVATPLNRGAGVVSSFMKADGIIVVDQNNEGYEAGEEVEVRLLKDVDQIKNTVVAIGSHDPLLDEVADMIHRHYPSMYMSSSHVGSMGTITAAKRHENHLGGIHMLDEETGEYNVSYLYKHFPKGGVRLVECVNRSQGLMVAKGNPLNIKGIEDITKQGLRYVNRQKGSGTRILIDYLCKKNNIDSSLIDGYDREEFTHTAVAAQIAGGTADAGMGIYSAAMIYGLDFIPICMEQYDLLIPDYAYDTPMVQTLLKVLQSAEFKERILAMGGYEVDKPGQVRLKL